MKQQEKLILGLLTVGGAYWAFKNAQTKNSYPTQTPNGQPSSTQTPASGGYSIFDIGVEFPLVSFDDAGMVSLDNEVLEPDAGFGVPTVASSIYNAILHPLDTIKEFIMDSVDKNTPRGIRNNNPGNIERSNNNWVGKIYNADDPRFEVFDTAENGIRALAKLLIVYDKKGFDSVRKIVTKYAPASENNTQSYIKSVSDYIGLEPDDEIDISDDQSLLLLIQAIILHENGILPYGESIIFNAIQRARQ